MVKLRSNSILATGWLYETFEILNHCIVNSWVLLQQIKTIIYMITLKLSILGSGNCLVNY